MSNHGVSHQLERAFEDTRTLFEQFVVQTHLAELLNDFSDWAVVGGAVRDVLLADDSDSQNTTPPWQDLDIAVAHDSQESLLAAFAHAPVHWQIRLNSFGGVKATLPALGSIDLWVTGTHAPRRNQERHQYWTRYLETVDFGVNAVAFAWPNCDLVVHDRWVEDVHSNCVELLSHRSPRKEIQPLRAIALAAALTYRSARPAHLGEGVWAEIEWLLDTPDHLQSALAYLRDKVASDRWKKNQLLPFLAHLVDQSHASTDKELRFVESLCVAIKHG